MGITFLLNDRVIEREVLGASDTLLDLIRLDERLTGTKEGCAEGDCGACTVLVGRLEGDGIVYEPVNACIRLAASCHRCHVVTVEHFAGRHPVQAAMVEHHASQCGFCTPGFVMALAALWRVNAAPDELAVETALQGNLCRCTGYEPIVRAGLARSGDDPLAVREAEVIAALRAIPAGRVEVARGADRAIVPSDADDLAAVLAEHPKATLVAGATDVGLWVTKHLRDISPAVFIGHLMRDVDVTKDEITLGAGVTYAEAAEAIIADYPSVADYWHRIGGWQVRVMGTVGGNIANGSPIGDSPPFLIALDARIVLRSAEGRREMALEDYFLDYGKQDRRPGEFLETVIIPRHRGDLVAAHKVSKRRDADISAVAMGLRLRLDGDRIAQARVAFGGMAGVPKRAAGAEAALEGATFGRDAFDAAARAVARDFTPMTDMRASADYRRTVAGNLIRRVWAEHEGGAGARLGRRVTA